MDNRIEELSAEKMFNELGFWIINKNPLTYQFDDGGYITQYLFNPVTQGLQISEWEEYSDNKPQGQTTLYIEHIKAIVKQMEELGWEI